MSTDVPVHHYTCSVYLFLFGITSTVTFQLICWGTYTHIYPKIKLPVYLHASLLFNHKYLPVSTTTCVPAHMYPFITLPVHFDYFIPTNLFSSINWFSLCVFHLALHAHLSVISSVGLRTDRPIRK